MSSRSIYGARDVGEFRVRDGIDLLRYSEKSDTFSFWPYIQKNSDPHSVEGTGSELEKILNSCRRSEFLWQPETATDDFVDPKKIVWTDHGSYQGFYPASEDGSIRYSPGDKFPGKRGDPGPRLSPRDDWKNGWSNHDNGYINLYKHPDLEKYYVSGGNHRVMKSKIEKGPPVSAKVTLHKWKWAGDLLKYFAEKSPFYIKVWVSTIPHEKLILKIRSTENSRLFHFMFDSDMNIADWSLFCLKLHLSEASFSKPGEIVRLLNYTRSYRKFYKITHAWYSNNRYSCKLPSWMNSISHPVFQYPSSVELKNPYLSGAA